MGKITLEMLAKSPSHTKKRRDETVQQYVRRLTHLYFSEKNIDEIVSVDRLAKRRLLSVDGVFHRYPCHLAVVFHVNPITYIFDMKLWITKLSLGSGSSQSS